MKKVLAALLALTTLACAFTSCGDTDDDAPKGRSGNKAQTEVEDSGDEDDAEDDENDKDNEDEDGDSEEETTRRRRGSKDNDDSDDDGDDDNAGDDGEDEDSGDKDNDDGGEDEDIPQDTTAPQQSDSNQTVEFTVGDSTEQPVGNSVKKYFTWLDISKHENYFFENEFVQLRFRVKDDAPDGLTTIEYVTDLANYDGRTVKADAVLNSTVAVNTVLQPRALTSDDIMTIYGTNVAAVPGEEFSVYLCVKNNPGLVAFIIYFTYDSSVLDFIEAVPTGEFASIASGLSAF